MALAVHTRRLNGLEEHVEQELQVDDLLVVDDVHGLGMSGGVGINLLVSGMLGVAVGKAYFSCADTLYLFEEMLGAPEASSGQINLFRHGFTC